MLQYSVPLLLLFITCAVTSFITTAAVKRIAEKVGAIDHPNERKQHAESTPRMGGLAIIFGFGFPLMLLAANAHAAELVSKNLSYLFAVLASGSLIVGLGVPWMKHAEYPDDNHIDLEPMLRDVIMLAFPLRPLHDENCRGLCATCGADLNGTDCGHTQQPEDLRWAPLRTALTKLERSS